MDLITTKVSIGYMFYLKLLKDAIKLAKINNDFEAIKALEEAKDNALKTQLFNKTRFGGTENRPHVLRKLI